MLVSSDGILEGGQETLRRSTLLDLPPKNMLLNPPVERLARRRLRFMMVSGGTDLARLPLFESRKVQKQRPNIDQYPGN